MTVILSDMQAQVLVWAEAFSVEVTEFSWSAAIQFSSVTSAVTTGGGSFISFVSENDEV